MTRVALVLAMLAGLVPGWASPAQAEGSVTFEGGGYGHGVGMPQYGAQGKALEGDTAEEIVEYYYTDARMVSLKNAVGAQGSPLLDYNNPLWLGIAPDQTLLQFKAVGGDLEICQPSVECPLPSQPEAGETWELKLRTDGQCVFKHNGTKQADPGECWASVELLGSARIEFPSIGKTIGHGEMRVRPKNTVADPQKFHVSFNMKLNEYVSGVREAFNSWEPAALQAQAVASRSFAVAKAHQRETGPRSGSNPGFSSGWKSICWCHVRATTVDQAYFGWEQTQDPSWSAAVSATKKKVLTHDDAAFTERGVVSAFFSSSSSGVTETNVGGFGSSVQYPFLISVPDPWSAAAGANNPFASWEETVSGSVVRDKLRTANKPWEVDFDTLTSVQHIQGPPESIVRFTGTVDGSQESVEVPGWWLRPAFGLRSPQITDVLFDGTDSQTWHQDVGSIPSPVEDGDRFGSVFSAGDFNGDGNLDLAVSAYNDGINTIAEGGLVNVLYGGSGGLTSSGSQMIHEDETGVPGTAEPFDHFGKSLATGDFDDDGYDDLAIGIPGQDSGSKNDVGAVLVVFGSAGGLDKADSHLVGPTHSGAYGVLQTDMRYGWSLAAGDFDGDDKDDLAVGAPGRNIDGNDGAGRVQVLRDWDGSGFDQVKGISQATSDVPGEPQVGDEFSFSVATGDFDGDGFADLVAGSPGDTQGGHDDAGLVVVMYGSSSGISTEGSLKISQKTSGIPGAPSDGARFGETVATGRLDNDDRDDLVIGSPHDEVSGIKGGSATLVYADSSGFAESTSQRLRQGAGGLPGAPEAGDDFGAALAIGDIHLDGHNDLLIGAPGESTGGVGGAGMVRLVKGSSTGLKSGKGTSKNQSKPGFDGTMETGDHFGLSVGLWDFDGDSRADWVVGAPDEDTGGSVDAGVFHIVHDFG